MHIKKPTINVTIISTIFPWSFWFIKMIKIVKQIENIPVKYGKLIPKKIN